MWLARSSLRQIGVGVFVVACLGRGHLTVNPDKSELSGYAAGYDITGADVNSTGRSVEQ